ncbi:MAG: methyltransferase domain-containing protein [Acidobacteriaceae bacterium]
MRTLISPDAAFDAWAEVYDTQPNPLLALEHGALMDLLPEVRGLDILDTGCGTGRWLRHFAERSPRRLTGVDASAEMIAAAGRKLGDLCELKLGSCTSLPFAEEGADLVLSSFVLSYVDDLDACAAEVDRVLRPGGSFFLSDMHPETEISLGWKRSFTLHGAEMSVHSRNHSLPRILEVFERHGLRLAARNEPAFGAAEQAIFAQRGKSKSWADAQASPAIYVLKWRKPASAPRVRRSPPAGQGVLVLRGARCADGPDRVETRTLSIVNGCIQPIESQTSHANVAIDLDLSDCLILPGLINAHDHLEFGLFPRLGNGPYENAGQWANDIHLAHKETIARFRRVPRESAVVWGAIRNLLCGVTTVCHHNPIYPEMMAPGFPVRLARDFAWAHSCAFEPQLAKKFAASDASLPFIVHAAEGIDQQSDHEIFLLDLMNALSERTLLVHGLGCSAEAIALINQRRATVVLCPTSNEFLFHRSPALESIRSFRSVILGSDSPLTAEGDLLDEIHFAHWRTGLDAATLYRMVTTKAARALRFRRGEGTLAPGAVADVLVLRDAGLTPGETLVRMTIEQLELVIVGGRVQLASPAFMRHLPPSLVDQLELLEVGGHRRWLRAPIRALLATAEQCLGETVKIGGKRVRHVIAA